jgi:hypothetical protein
MTDVHEYKSLLGQQFTEITGMTVGSEEVRFTVSDGRTLVMKHFQDCCERVSLDQIDGDVTDLLNSPISMAEMVTEDASKLDEWGYEDSATWTFYRFATAKGYVTIKWYGSSNGYYSERVTFFDNGGEYDTWGADELT